VNVTGYIESGHDTRGSDFPVKWVVNMMYRGMLTRV